MPSTAEAAIPIPLRVDGIAGAALPALMQFEGEVRRQPSVAELCYLVANDLRRIVSYDQAFVLREAMAGTALHVVCASSIAVVDRNAPLIQAVERHLAAHLADTTEPAPAAFDLARLSDDPVLADYPFLAWHWQPLDDRTGKTFAGLVLTRETPFDPREATRIARAAETIAHAWLALTAHRPVRKLWLPSVRQRGWLLAAAAAIALFPVRMSVLAPMEVVAARPYVVSAPFAGVIREIAVAPNTMVRQGQPVLVFEDVKVRNELAQAEERLAVARAKLERASSAAFADAAQAHDIAQLQAEADLARSDFAYARDVMAKSQVLAPRAGMVLYSDRRDWEGRAVNVGDPIVQIVDPRQVAFHVELPAKEQLRLNAGAPMQVWLDAEPLWALGGRVVSASYQARPTPEGVLSFAVIARPDGTPPRIGSRGTARLYGRWVPLSYALLRRPIAALRQTIGL
ncbi:efflux RND transporter periplasmic adaptor subunit [Sphingomonas sp. PAMC 26617]|uniref:efflux RND transporter periplasmic adaptor subunit n=1 Tax=Sphingomonas sp. PAMC 26617 TaxID=1112216 RepID=UPI0002887506|nr:HlyD family efflux transporter periplasmic adaptor subunit [Sphingomonas sp. PAMC 26617]